MICNAYRQIHTQINDRRHNQSTPERQISAYPKRFKMTDKQHLFIYQKFQNPEQYDYSNSSFFL